MKFALNCLILFLVAGLVTVLPVHGTEADTRKFYLDHLQATHKELADRFSPRVLDSAYDSWRRYNSYFLSDHISLIAWLKLYSAQLPSWFVEDTDNDNSYMLTLADPSTKPIELEEEDEEFEDDYIDENEDTLSFVEFAEQYAAKQDIQEGDATGSNESPSGDDSTSVSSTGEETGEIDGSETPSMTVESPSAESASAEGGEISETPSATVESLSVESPSAETFSAEGSVSTSFGSKGASSTDGSSDLDYSASRTDVALSTPTVDSVESGTTLSLASSTESVSSSSIPTQSPGLSALSIGGVAGLSLSGLSGAGENFQRVASEIPATKSDT